MKKLLTETEVMDLIQTVTQLSILIMLMKLNPVKKLLQQKM